MTMDAKLLLTGGTAGGQTLTLTGTGFDSTASVLVCTSPCQYINTTTTELKCKTPANSGKKPCCDDYS